MISAIEAVESYHADHNCAESLIMSTRQTPMLICAPARSVNAEYNHHYQRGSKHGRLVH